MLMGMEEEVEVEERAQMEMGGWVSAMAMGMELRTEEKEVAMGMEVVVVELWNRVDEMGRWVSMRTRAPR
jgi:hypothetical protein